MPEFGVGSTPPEIGRRMKVVNVRGTYRFEGENTERGILLWTLKEIDTGAVRLFDPTICVSEDGRRLTMGKNRGLPLSLKIDEPRKEIIIRDEETGEEVIAI